MPDLTYTLIVSEKKLNGNDGSIAAVAPGENNTMIAQFAGLIPRDRVRDIDLLDQIKVEVTFMRAAQLAAIAEPAPDLAASAGETAAAALPVAAPAATADAELREQSS